MGIETERLLMRPFTAEDVNVIHRIWTEPGVRLFLWDNDIIPPEMARYVVTQSADMFQREGAGIQAVVLRGTNELIGFCGYWYFHEPPQLELSFGLTTAQWGKGLAQEAARAMIRYGFEQRGMEKIEASADVPNLVSLGVMEKIGMRLVKEESVNGKPIAFYDITREAWRPHASRYEVIQAAA
ncbi:MAG: GNAT family N-acetyltransferase [Blastocatellia bacterium]